MSNPSLSDIGEIDFSKVETSAQKPEPKFVPKVKLTDDRVQELEETVRKILATAPPVQNQKPVLKAAVKKALDYTKLTEDDIYNLSIPIEVVDHGLPETMKVALKDTTYEPRWVNIHAARLGPMRASGYTYVTKADLAMDLNLNVEEDENGTFKYIDTVLMKCLKSALYGKLRANYETSVRAVDPHNAQLRGKQVTEGYMNDNAGGAFKDATSQNKMDIYLPLDK